MEKPSEVTQAEKWKRPAERAETLTLPSGNVVKARRPSLFLMMKRGILPTHLYKTAMSVTDGTNTDPAAMKPEDLKSYFDFFMIYVVEAVVEPKIILKGDPKSGEVSIDEFTDDDMFAVFKGVNALPESTKDAERREESAKLEPFRKEPKSGNDSSSGKGVSSPAVGAS